MNRYQAAGLHFLGSAAVLFLIFAMIRWVWYPQALFTAANGVNMLGILVAVDVVLGPLIMLIIFKPNKPGLKLDISIVLTCQLLFMSYGAWTVFQARPVFVVFTGDGYHVTTANEVEEVALKQAAYKQFKHLPLLGPEVVGTKPPTDEKKKEDLMLGALAGLGMKNLPEYFVPYDTVLPQVKQAAKPAAALKVSAEDKARVAQYQANGKHQDMVFLPVRSKRARLMAAIDPQTGKLVELF